MFMAAQTLDQAMLALLLGHDNGKVENVVKIST